LATASVVLLLIAGMLLSRRPEPRTVLTAPTMPVTQSARCPKGALEEHGVCLPVPAPAAPSGDFVSVDPRRSKDLADYFAPVPGPSEITTSGVLPLPDTFRRDGPALVVSVAGAETLSLQVLDLPGARVASSNEEQGWLLLSSQTGSSPMRLVLLAGLSALGEPGPEGAVAGDARLGVVEETLYLAVRQVTGTPGGLSEVELWGSASSVAVDPRNVLRPRGASAPAAAAPAVTE